MVASVWAWHAARGALTRFGSAHRCGEADFVALLPAKSRVQGCKHGSPQLEPPTRCLATLMGDEGWNAFVKECLGAHCDGYSVLDARDGRVWGTSPDFGPRTYTATLTNDAGEDAEQRLNEADIAASFGRGARHAAGLRYDRVK